MPAFTIRRATLDDAHAICDIYNHYVLTSTCTYQYEPETLEQRQAWLAQRSEKHPALVATIDQLVVGWASLSPWKDREGYRFAVEFSVYIHHDYHRRGLGRALIAELIHLAREAGYHTMLGGACSSQTGSLALQEAMGFQRVAHLKEVGYKFDRWLDVIYLQLIL
jgi:phosphinothricin acetyltransferase